MEAIFRYLLTYKHLIRTKRLNEIERTISFKKKQLR